MLRAHHDDLLLGEWACLGILHEAPAHGFAVAARLKPDADVGRVWSLSRALTYRSLEQLQRRSLVEPIGEEPGIAGGNRTVLRATRSGRAQFRRWVRTPVTHLRDLRSELLLKIVLAERNGIDIHDTLSSQRDRIAEFVVSLEGVGTDPGTGAVVDVVVLWRQESARAALAFLDRMLATGPAASPGGSSVRRR